MASSSPETVNQDQQNEEGHPEASDLLAKIKEELRKGVVLGLHQHKQMMSDLIENNLLTDSQIENHHDKCMQLIEDAFAHSLSPISSEILTQNSSLYAAFQKKLHLLQRKAKSHLSSFVRKHELFLEELSKKATECANTAECLYQDEMEQILNIENTNFTENDVDMADEQCRHKAIEKFELLSSEKGLVNPDIWLFELEAKMDEILIDFKNDIVDNSSHQNEIVSTLQPFNLDPPSGSEHERQNGPLDGEEPKITLVTQRHSDNDDDEALQISQSTEAPFTSAPVVDSSNEKLTSIQSATSLPQNVEPTQPATLTVVPLKIVAQTPPKVPPRLKPARVPAPATPPPVLPTTSPNVKPPRKSIDSPRTSSVPQVRIDRTAHPRTADDQLVAAAKIQKKASMGLTVNQLMDSTFSNGAEPINVGIVMDKRTVSVSTYNYRNSGNFMELICKQISSISTTSGKLCFCEEPPKPKEKNEGYFTLWDLLTAPPIKTRKIQVAGQNVELSNEEVIASFFAHLKFRVESRMSAVVTKVVFALSFFATSALKERIQDAAALAGFPEILIVSSALATALVEAKSIPRSSDLKLICVAEYDEASFTVSVAAIQNNSVSMKAAYRTKWDKSKPVAKMFGLLRAVGGGEEPVQPIRDQIVESLLSGKVAVQKFKIETPAGITDRWPSDGLLVVSNGRDLSLDHVIMAKWRNADKKILESYSTVHGASLLASAAENTFSIRDLKLGDLGPWGNSRLGLKSSYNVTDFSVNSKEGSTTVFKKTLKFRKIGINYNVELSEIFSDRKDLTVCMYQVTSRAEKKCSVTVTCEVNKSGVYSLHFDKDDTVDVSRISRLLTGTEVSSKFGPLLEEIRQGRIKWRTT